MKNNKSLIALVLAMVLLLGGAYVLYNQVGKDNAPDALVVKGGAQAEENQTAPTAAPADQNSPEAEPSNEPEPTAEPKPTAPPLAPDFTVYDRDGNEVKLSSFFGKPIVLNFWASWCPPCRMEMPDFNYKYLELGSEVHFLMVNLTAGRETKKSAEDFIKEENFAFPIYFDTTQMAAMTYNAFSLPTTYFINADGVIVAQASGAINAATLQRGIDMITQ